MFGDCVLVFGDGVWCLVRKLWHSRSFLEVVVFGDGGVDVI